MEKFRYILRKFLYPPIWLVILLVFLSGILLTIVFSLDLKYTVLAYITYPVSAYMLVVFGICLPEIGKRLKKWFQRRAIVQALEQHPIGHRYLNDITFRGTASIYQGLAANFAYAVFRAVTAIQYHSIWFGAISWYYILLSAIRLTLAWSRHKAAGCKEEKKRLEEEYKGYRLCGYLMVVLNLGMAAMTVQMIWYDQHYEYPGFIIYVSAAYTFYGVITAGIQLFRRRRLQSPILSAAKAVSFAGALMSVLALQTAMLTTFGTDNIRFRQTTNMLTGSIVCMTVVGMAIFMIMHAGKMLRQLGKNYKKIQEI